MMRTALRQAKSALNHESHALYSPIPTFLCPALLRLPLSPPVHTAKRPQTAKLFSTYGRRRHEALTPQEAPESRGVPEAPEAPNSQDASRSSVQLLPRACPGCGAASQTYDEEVAGYYTLGRRHVKQFLQYDPNKVESAEDEDSIYSKALQALDPAVLEELGLDKPTVEATGLEETEETPAPEAPPTPICDRCHNLVHYHKGTSIHHPSVDAIQQTIAESPHRRNHIYHVVDAADFPLSLIPNLQSTLRLPKLRTQNRRAKHKGWVGENRIAEVSFIITRSDLLAPKKEQVDQLLPYMQDVLRDALGRVNKNARLGNVHMVSAVRGWWSKKIKEDIWDRGGAGWMVGKVNVGKSKLYEAVFPKGRGADFVNVAKIRSQADREQMIAAANSVEELKQVHAQLDEEDRDLDRRRRQPILEPSETLPEEDMNDFDADSLLPPRQPFTMYPVMPLDSSLPGTTASPIRIPYGRNRGELIDLPGIARTSPDLSSFVKPEDHDELVMTDRVKPQRLVVKPGQSLVLGGGLVRITPVTEDVVFLIHAFVPLEPHITRTEKAIGMQAQDGTSHVESVLAPYAGRAIKSAGTFKLKWDATKQLGGALTSTMAGKMKPENLPFTIWSTDLLIEGVGWVEITAQVRKPRGWKPVGMVKKDPNHAKYAREAKLAEERRLQKEKYEAKIASGGGDAFDKAGFNNGPTTSEGWRREKELDKKREAAQDFVEGFVNPYPEVEVFTPLGKYVGARRPMCGSVLGGPKPISSRERMARPRRAMASVRGKASAGKKEARRLTSGRPARE